QRQRADRAGRTDLPAIVAARFATVPVGLHFRRPETFGAWRESLRLEHFVRAGLEALAAADAHLEELFLRHAAGRPHGDVAAFFAKPGAECFAHAEHRSRSAGRGGNETATREFHFAHRRI